jgi:hypothetical protein
VFVIELLRVKSSKNPHSQFIEVRGSRALYMLVLRKHGEIATKSLHIANDFICPSWKRWELGFGSLITKLCNSDADARDDMESKSRDVK